MKGLFYIVYWKNRRWWLEWDVLNWDDNDRSDWGVVENRSNRSEEFKELGGYDIGWIIFVDIEIFKNNRSSGK